VSLQKRLKDGMDVLSFASYEREREREREGERERGPVGDWVGLL